MGTYLSAGIAVKLWIKRENFTKEEILDRLKENLNLNLYDVNEKSENYLVLEIKKEIFENNIVELLNEECEFCRKDEKEEIQNRIEEIKGKSYDEILEIAEQRKIGFAYLEGCKYTNDVSYIGSKLNIFCDGIFCVNDGKIIMECYYDIFYTLRNHIIKSMTNVLKDAMIITMT